MIFSVIVPVYGVEQYLRKCVDSVLSQSFEDYEIILVDDGSKDNCPAICDEYASADSRIRVIHKENGGLVSARNAGIKSAQGDYICYVDGDDLVTDNWLSCIYEKIQSSEVKPDIVVFGAEKVFSDHNEIIEYTVPEGFYDKDRLEKELYPILFSDRRYHLGKEAIYPAVWAKAFKRELLSEHYCKDEKITRGEDTTVSMECLIYAQNIVVCYDVLYYYNKKNSGSLLTKYDDKRLHAYKREFDYMAGHVVGIYPCIDAQMNDFYINYIGNALNHELLHHPKISEAARNTRKNMKETGIMDYVTPRGLPLSAKILAILLKMHFYRLALLGCKIWVKRKED